MPVSEQFIKLSEPLLWLALPWVLLVHGKRARAYGVSIGLRAASSWGKLDPLLICLYVVMSNGCPLCMATYLHHISALSKLLQVRTVCSKQARMLIRQYFH